MAIKQTISLDGLQTVQKELRNLADVGESAFSRIRAAVEGGGGGLEGIATNILSIGKALTSLTGAVTIFTGLTASLVGLTVSASNAGEEFENLGKQLGTSTDDASALISSFARAGADIEGLAMSLKRAAVNISAEWAQIQTSVREAGLKTVANNTAVIQSINNLAKASVTAAEQEHNAALQREADTQAVADAQANLDDLLEKRRISRGGERDPVLEAERARAREEAQIAKAQLQLAQAEQKAKEDAALAEQKAADAAIARQTAQLALAKARMQAAEDEKNSITNLVGFVNDLAAGLTNTGRKVNATVDNLFKGIIASAGGLDASFGPIEGDIASIGSPKVIDVLFKMSDVLKNMTSDTEKMALASKLMGRAVGQEMVTFLSQGRGGIQAYIESVKELGLQFTDEMAHDTQQFRRSLFTLEDTLSRIKDQIGAVFAPVFGPFFEQLANLIARNRTLFIGWAQALRDTVQPTLNSIVRVMSGDVGRPEDQWLVDLIRKFKEFASVIGDIVVPALKGLLNVIGEVADGINEMFGTKLNAASLIFLAWIAKILGGFRLISIAITLLGGAFGALAASAGVGLGPLIATIAAVTAGILLLLDALGDKSAWDVFKSLAKDLGDVEKSGQRISSFFGGIRDEVRGLFKTIQESSGPWDFLWRILSGGGNANKVISISFDVKVFGDLGWDALKLLLLGPKGPQNQLRKLVLGPELTGAAPSFGAAGSEATIFAEETKKSGDEGKKAGEDTAAGFEKAAASIKSATTATQQNTSASIANNLQKKNFIDLTVEETNALHDFLVEQRNASKPIGAPKFVTPPGEPPFQPAGQLLPTGQATTPTQQAQQAAQQPAQQIQQAFQAASDKIKEIWTGIIAFISDTSQITAAFASISDELVGPFLDAHESIMDVFDGIASDAERMAERIVQAAQRAAQAIQQISFAGFGGAAEGAPFAGGGRVVGPGSWTSDSIPAWLSRDEFVQPAFRVHQYGMDFMEAIRRGLLSTDAVRMLMGDFNGFSLGGSSSASFPRFAAGGSVSDGAMRTLQLVLGGQTFETRGPAKVIDALEREAALQNIASTGIAQSFVGRR